MNNKLRDFVGVGILLLGFLVFMINPVRFTGMAIGGSQTISVSILPLIGMVIMALGIYFLASKFK